MRSNSFLEDVTAQMISYMISFVKRLLFQMIQGTAGCAPAEWKGLDH